MFSIISLKILWRRHEEFYVLNSNILGHSAWEIKLETPKNLKFTTTPKPSLNLRYKQIHSLNKRCLYRMLFWNIKQKKVSNEIRNIAGNIDSTKKADHILEMQKLEEFLFKSICRLATFIFCVTPWSWGLQMISWRRRPQMSSSQFSIKIIRTTTLRWENTI